MYELHRGEQIGKDVMQGKKNPIFLAGKGVRKVIDPKHKMKFGEKNE